MLEKQEFRIEDYGSFLEEISEGRMILLLDKDGELIIIQVGEEEMTEEQVRCLEKVLLVTGTEMSVMLRVVLFVDILWARFTNWISERF